MQNIPGFGSSKEVDSNKVNDAIPNIPGIYSIEERNIEESFTCWESTTQKNGVIFCLCDRSLDVKNIISKITDAFPNDAFGVVMRKPDSENEMRNSNSPCIEFAFSSEKPREILTKYGLLYGKRSGKVIYPVFTSHCLPDILKIRLSYLPIIEKDELRPYVHQLMGRYGNVVYVLICTGLYHGLFEGKAFLILDRTNVNGETYEDLPTKTPYLDDDKKEVFIDVLKR